MGDIYKKIQAVQNRIKAGKDAYNSFGRYQYRNIETITKEARPLLTEQGLTLMLTDDLVEVGGNVYVKAIARITDTETGETVETTAYAREAQDKKGMDASQMTGSASTYARKYAVQGLLLLDDGKQDPDSMDNRTQGQQTIPTPVQTQAMQSAPPMPRTQPQPQGSYYGNGAVYYQQAGNF